MTIFKDFYIAIQSQIFAIPLYFDRGLILITFCKGNDYTNIYNDNNKSDNDEVARTARTCHGIVILPWHVHARPITSSNGPRHAANQSLRLTNQEAVRILGGGANNIDLWMCGAPHRTTGDRVKCFEKAPSFSNGVFSK